MNVINVDKSGKVIEDLTKVVLPPDLQEALNNATQPSHSDEGFVGVWIDDSRKGAAPDMAINANLVYKIEQIEEG